MVKKHYDNTTKALKIPLYVPVKIHNYQNRFIICEITDFCEASARFRVNIEDGKTVWVADRDVHLIEEIKRPPLDKGKN